MIERGKTYTPEELKAALDDDMGAAGLLAPDALLEAAEHRRAEFEAAIAPASVVFDYDWPRGQLAPSLGVGFQLGERLHAVRVPQTPDFKVIDNALAYITENRERLLAKLAGGAE